MTKYNNPLYAAAKVAILGTTLILINALRTDTDPQQPPSASVTVVKPNANPAPATINSTNNATTPLFVKDVDYSSHEPFVMRWTVSVAAGTSIGAAFSSPVPAGKRLVVEQVTVDGQIRNPVLLIGATVGVDDRIGRDIILKPNFIGATSSDPFDPFHVDGVTQQVRLFVNPGQRLSGTARLNLPGNGSSSVIFHIIGYLVDVPVAGSGKVRRLGF
jgi:hypothetical protein